jgi:hypothetical protein
MFIADFFGEFVHFGDNLLGAFFGPWLRNFYSMVMGDIVLFIVATVDLSLGDFNLGAAHHLH